MTQEFGENLRKLRTLSDKSQNDVAKAIDVSLSTYSRLERGEISIDFDTAVKIARYYKLTLDELYNYSDPDFKASEPKTSYLKKWSVPVTVSLDGTEENLQMWLTKLTAINAAI